MIWLLRKDSIGRNGMLCTDAKPVELRIGVPSLSTGCYSVTGWKTHEGRVCAVFEVKKESKPCLQVQVPPFITDLALAIRGQELHRAQVFRDGR